MISSDFIDDTFSTDTNAPKITLTNDVDYVKDLTITIVSTKDTKVPPKPVQLSILACIHNTSIHTKGVTELRSEFIFLHN